MPQVDAKLAASLKQAKIGPMSFVFVAKGNEGKLLVDKKKISPKDAADAKKECGGGMIFRGRCHGEEAKMVFEVGKEVPATLSALTKKIIKQDAGLTFEVEYRFAADLAADENQAESVGEGATPAAGLVPPAPPQPPVAPASASPPPQPPVAQAPPSAPPQPQVAQGGADVIKRLNGMAPDIKTALAGPNKARVQTLVVAVNGLIKTKDFVQANRVLDELAPLVKQAPAPLAPVAGMRPPVQSPAPPESSAAGLDQAKADYEAAAASASSLMARLNEGDGAAVRDYLEEANATLEQPKTTASDYIAATARLGELKDILQTDLPDAYNEAIGNLAQTDEAAAESPLQDPVEEAPPEDSVAEQGSAEQAAPEQPAAETPLEDVPAEQGTAEQVAPDAPADGEGGEPSLASQYEAAYNGLLPTVEGDLQQIQANDPDAAAPIQQSVDYAKAYAQSADFVNAYAWLDQAAQELAKAQGAGRAQEAADVIPGGEATPEGAIDEAPVEEAAPEQPATETQSEDVVAETPVQDRAKPRGAVAYAKLLLDWRAAQEQVVANIATVGRAILAREDVQGDPRLEQVRAAVAAMPTLVPAFGEELNDLIDGAMNAGPGPEAAELLDKAQAVVSRYRVQLTSAAVLARLEELAANHAVGESDVFSTLDTALAALEGEFAARGA